MLTLGVISDTHVPDKVARLNPRAVEVFRQAAVHTILHAGDISTPVVIEQLEQVAPVLAVKVNRDWLYFPRLPRQRVLNFDGVRVGLAHGHGGPFQYIIGKYFYYTEGYRLERFRAPLLAAFQDMDVIIFGHTHRPVNQYEVGPSSRRILLFNPGSACCTDERDESPPCVGLLHISQGAAHGEHVILG